MIKVDKQRLDKAEEQNSGFTKQRDGVLVFNQGDEANDNRNPEAEPKEKSICRGKPYDDFVCGKNR